VGAALVARAGRAVGGRLLPAPGRRTGARSRVIAAGAARAP